MPAQHATIADAVAAATDGDDIEVGPGTWVEPLVLDKDLNLVGVQGSGTTIIRVQSADGAIIVTGSAAELRGFQVDNPGDGPAIRASVSSLVLTDVWLEKQSATDEGAGLRAIDTDVQVWSSRFFDNASEKHGGHIYLSGGSLAVTDSQFEQGWAYDRGGAIYADNASITVSGSAFVDNAAGKRGGAVAAVGGNADLFANSFTRNTADEGGGAMWLQSDTAVVMVTGNSFVSNTAGRGGAIQLEMPGEVLGENNVFCTNHATNGDGGGVYTIDSGNAWDNLWTNNVFVENTAAKKGGAFAANQEFASLRNNHLLGNEAGETGGGAFFSNATVVFDSNLVAWTPAGDGVTATGQPTQVRYSLFWDNTPANWSGSATSGPGNLFTDPLVQAYSLDGDCSNDAPWQVPGSPLIDNGNPNNDDPDGTVNDIGAWGGETAGDRDHDGDGFDLAVDCDDTVFEINPGAQEVCDDFDVDEDCDGLADDLDPGGASETTDWYADLDEDGWGDPLNVLTACEQPAGFLARDGDCDDTDETINPDGTEVCDPDDTDEDCDGTADNFDPDAQGETLWYPDADEDLWGDASSPGIAACDAPWEHVADHTDCDDTRADVNPGAQEVCDDDNTDEDCDTLADDDDPSAAGKTMWCADDDGDGFGDAQAVPTEACEAGELIADCSDCDDARASVYPGATEVFEDGIDQDCDGADPTVRYANACGCSTGAATGWWALLPALLLLRRRR